MENQMNGREIVKNLTIHMMTHFSHSSGCLGEHHVGFGGSGFSF
jgi:hypothetical protein